MQQWDLLVVENLERSFTMYVNRCEIHVCRGTSLHLAKGEFIGTTGKGGSGKSTILEGIYRINLPQRGRILYDSEKLRMLDLCQVSKWQMIYLHKQEIGYVSQFLRIMPRTAARQTIKQVVLEMGMDEDTARHRVQYMLGYFKLEPTLWDMYPNTFSGGEELQLNTAAAIVKRPRLLLLDEPTASLNHTGKQKVHDLIEQLKLEGTTMFGTFHDLKFMERLCDREYNMREGIIA